LWGRYWGVFLCVSSKTGGKVFTKNENFLHILFSASENLLSRTDQEFGFSRVFLLIF